MTRVAGLAAAAVLLAALPLMHPTAGNRAAAAATVYTSPKTYSTVVSTTFTLDLMADCGLHADAVSLVVSFDPRLLQAQSVTADSAFPQTLRKTIDNGLGKVYYDAGAPLTCHDDGNCPSGVVRVARLNLVTVGAAAGPTAVTIAGKIVWSGGYVFNGSGTGSAITIRLRGDVDVDCDVDLTDMMLVAQAWDKRTGEPGFVAAYDLDANGLIDILDVMNVAVHWGDVCVVP
ncbi:MAG TPA: dockerin type I domain-containing protein [Anaerolineae bacterium]|nr:dockerin type I domain-containing protein [Anaerolineae bacterium]